jgi:hypothetical protein
MKKETPFLGVRNGVLQVKLANYGWLMVTIGHLLLIATERLGEALRVITKICFEKTETLALKPVKIIPVPVHFILQTRFAISSVFPFSINSNDFRNRDHCRCY